MSEKRNGPKNRRKRSSVEQKSIRGQLECVRRLFRTISSQPNPPPRKATHQTNKTCSQPHLPNPPRHSRPPDPQKGPALRLSHHGPYLPRREQTEERRQPTHLSLKQPNKERKKGQRTRNEKEQGQWTHRLTSHLVRATQPSPSPCLCLISGAQETWPRSRAMWYDISTYRKFVGRLGRRRSCVTHAALCSAAEPLKGVCGEEMSCLKIGRCEGAVLRWRRV
ncbi:uncharacterized protein J3D65DRAFT_458558 [Phyllosticta citribraziliensis]|uniref:Uncharacterized protein n=1 Tax=Phyllosticta citribraziliensis TaxID=989973 RepID=A0ABR1LJ00_9PEZI